MSKKVVITIIMIITVVVIILMVFLTRKKDDVALYKNVVEIRNSGEYTSFYNNETLLYEFYDKNGRFIGSVADRYEYEYYLENPEALLKLDEIIHEIE